MIRKVFAIVFGIFMLASASRVNAQCSNCGSQYPAGTQTTSSTSWVTISTCVYGGQYAICNVTAGSTYQWQTCGDTDFDTQITVRQTNCAGAVLGYNDDGCGSQSIVTWTATFTGTVAVLVSQYSCASNSLCMTLQWRVVTPPANDNPCSATALTVNTSCSYTASTNLGATPTVAVPDPPCGNYQGGDVWFRVTVPASGHVIIDSDDGVVTDGAMAVYTGPACGTLTFLTCDDDGSINGLMPMINVGGLTPGSSLWIRFWEYGNNNNGSFSICAWSPPVPTTADCLGYIPVCSNSYSPTTAPSGIGSYNDVPSGVTPCGTYEQDATWYTFTVLTSGTFEFRINANGADYDYALYNITNNDCYDIMDGTINTTACNWAYPPNCGYYDTGMDGAIGTSYSEDDLGSGYCESLPVTAGQTYTLLVDNYDHNGINYSITFYGSASIFDNIGPTLESVVPPSCGDATLDFAFSEGVLCSSVQASDLQLTGPGGPYSLSNIQGVECNTGALYGQNYSVNVSPALVTSGNFTLSLVSSVTDQCGNPTVSNNLNFTIVNVTASASVVSNVTCAGLTDGSALASGANGTTPYTYKWSTTPTQTTATATNLGAGVYTVTVTDAGGCAGTTTVTITTPGALNPGTIATNQTICTGGNPALLTSTANASGGSGAITYQWYYTTVAGCGSGWTVISGATGATYDPPVLTVPTCYVRVAHDNCGSEYSNVVTISVDPSLAAFTIVNPAPVCAPTTVNLTLPAVTNGVTYPPGTLTYWTNVGCTVPLATPAAVAASGTYYIQASNACGTVSQPVVVVIDPAVPVLTITNPAAVCTPATVDLTAAAVTAGSTGNGTLTYWTVAGCTGALATPNAVGTAGTYYIQSTNACGADCDAVTVSVAPSVGTPVFTAGALTVCQNAANETYTATATNSTGITYSLSPGGAGTINATTGVVDWNAGFTGTATVTASAAGCNGPTTANAVVTVNATPVVTATPASQTICSGETTSIALTSTPAGATFAWTASGGANIGGYSNSSGSTIAQTLTNSGGTPQNATYAVTPTLNGCPGTPTNIVVTVNPLPGITSTASTDVTFCSGSDGTITIVGSGFAPLQYSITGGAPFQGSGSFVNLGPGNYPVVVQNGYGCEYDGPTLTINDGSVLPPPKVERDTFYCFGEAIADLIGTPNSGGSITWYNNPACTPPSIGTGNTYSPTNAVGTTTYYATETVGGCVSPVASATIIIKPLPVVTATPPSDTICSGTAPSIALSSTPAGATFAWTVTPSGGTITGASASSGNSIAQTITNSGTAIGSATYAVTGTLNGCSGTPLNVPVFIQPVPNVTATPASQSICSGGTTGISLSGTVAGTTFSWTYVVSGSITGASNGSGGTIAQTLTNLATSAGTVTYTVTPSKGGCLGTPITVVVTVQPPVTVTATPATETICSGETTAITLSPSIGGATISWTVSAPGGVTGASNGSGTSIAQTITNTNPSTSTVTYTVTPTIGGCNGTPITVNVDVVPSPVATATPASASICSGSAPTINLTSTVAGTTFNWTVVADPGIFGAFASSGSTLSQTLTNINSSAGTATYTITPSANGCSGTPIVVVVTVYPEVNLILNPTSQTICSGLCTSIGLSSSVVGATFSWTVSVTGGITGASAGSGNTIAQCLTNPGTSSGTVTYTVTPTANGCPGTPETVVVTVNPGPTVSPNPAAQTICSGSSFNVALSSGVSGAAFSWTVVADPDITGATAGSGTTINQTLFNSALVSETATYSVTATASGCTGAPATVVITVSPKPDLTATPPLDTICNGTNTNFALSSSVGGVSFSWTATMTGTVTNALPGTGSSIVQTLFNSGTEIDSAIYYVTATAGGCSSNPIYVYALVNPVTTAVATPSSGTICSGGFVHSNLTSPIAGTTFTWTASGTAGTSGYSAGSGSQIHQDLDNTSASQGTVTYMVTPGINGCPGNAIPVVVTINPEPNATANPSPETICSDETINIALTSTVTGTSFNWTVSAPPAITGANSGTGNAIQDQLISSSQNPETVTYTVTPFVDTCFGTPITVIVTVNPKPVIDSVQKTDVTVCGGSDGTISVFASGSVASQPFEYSITGGAPLFANGGMFTGLGNGVYPVVVQNTYGCTDNTSTVVDILDGAAPAIPVAGTTATYCAGDVIADLTATAGGGGTLTWYSSSMLGPGDIIGTGTTYTPAATPGATNYYVTETVAGCESTPAVITITVVSLPVVTPTPASQTICSGGTTSISLTSSMVGTTYAWNPVVTGGLMGASSGTGTPIAQTLTNPDATANTATYTIIPTANTCAGAPVNVVITVQPVADVVANPNPLTICSGEATGITLTSGVAGATYAWTVSATGITGASAGSGASINQTLINSGTANATATYTVSPTANSCLGANGTVTVTVVPAPAVYINPTTQSICTGDNCNIALSSNVTGATYTWSAAGSSGFVGGYSNGSGATISQALVNSGTVNETVTYTITPSSGSCVGTPATATVTVKPGPDVILNPATQAICSGEIASIVISSSVSGASFTYTATPSGGVQGSSSGSGSTITQTLTSSSSSVESVVYSITPAANGCPGNPVDATVNVSPTATVLTTPTDQSICSGDLATINLTSSPPGASFSWTYTGGAVTGASAGTGTVINQNLVYTGSSTGLVTYTIMPSIGSCGGIASNATVSVFPEPTVTASPTAQAVCSGVATQINLTSNAGGTAYSWTVVASPGITGAAAGSGPQISQVLVNSNPSPATVTYTVTPNLGSCPGPPITVVVTVNPTPVATAAPTSQSICSGNMAQIALTSNLTSGTTFTWTASPSSGNVTGYLDGAGNSINQSLVNGGTGGSESVTYNIIPTAGSCVGASVTATVTVYPVPNVTASPSTQTICQNETADITLTSNVTGATFSWLVNPTTVPGATAGSGSQISQTITGSGTTLTYTIFPEANGCTGNSTTATVIVNSAPAVNIFPSSSTICSGSATSIQLSSIPAGANFSWTVTQNGVTGATSGSGNVINQNLSTTGATQGTATYVVTPVLNGCTGSSANATVTVIPIPDADAGIDQTICSGNSTTLTATGGATYYWSTSGNTSTITVMPTHTTTYTVTVSNGSCTATDNVTVTVNTLTVNAGMDQAVCLGSSTTLTATGATTYNWSTGQSGQTISITPTITSTITVTGSDGTCTATDVVVVVVNPVPTAVASADVTICPGNSTNLSAGGGTLFTWSHGAGNTSVVTVSPTVTTAYTVTVSNGYCTASDDVVVTVSPVPVVSAGPNVSVCSTGSVIINGSSAANYNSVAWSSNGSGFFADSLQLNPTYIISTQDSVVGSVTAVLSAFGDCGTASDTMVLSILPPPSVDAGPDTVLCGVYPLLLVNATANYYDSLLWQSRDSGYFANEHALNTIFYTDSFMMDSAYINLVLTIYSQCGNDSDSVKVRVVPEAMIQAMADQTIDIGTSIALTATGGVEYYWFPETWLSCTECESPLATPDTITNFVVIGITEDGCQAIDTVTIDIKYWDNLYIPNAFSPNSDGRNDILFVRGHGIKSLEFTVYDRWGEKVFESSHQKRGWDGTYKGQDLNSGVFGYYVSAQLYDGTRIMKKGNVTLVR